MGLQSLLTHTFILHGFSEYSVLTFGVLSRILMIFSCMTTRLKQKLTYLLTYLLLSPTQIIEGGQALGPLWIDALKGNGNQVCLDES